MNNSGAIYCFYNNMICVSFDAILTTGSISYKALSLKIFRKKINRVRRACRNNPALIEYASLPPIVKIALSARFGNPEPKEDWERAEVLLKIINGSSIAPEGSIGSQENIAEEIKGWAMIAKKWKQ